MASSLNDNVSSMPEGIDHSTTFVQADPSNFRAVVQKLTGATVPSRHAGKLTFAGIGHRRSGFKLHERRQTARKLEITLNDVVLSPAARQRSLTGYAGGEGETVMASPVSTLDVYGRGSPRTPMEEEDKAIAEKGFYLHPSPIRRSEPELLILFPLQSPENDPSYSSS